VAERPGIVRVGDRVVFSGAEYSVVALSGSLVRLVAASGETTVVAMAYLAGAPDFAVVGAGPRARVPPTGLLEALPDGVAGAAREWERHLIEVETGLPPGAEPGTAPKPEFDPVARTLTERAQAKADELSVSLRTVERMLRRYRHQGLWGLVDTRHAQRARPTGNVDPRVVAAAVTVIDAQTHASTGTKSRAVRQIRQLVDDEHGPGTVPMPSNATFYRLLDVLSAGRHTFGSAVTRRQTANRPDGAFTPITAARPGEQVHMDGTPLDVMAIMDDGVPGRPELVAAIDIGTRTLCAAILRPVGAKAVDAAVLLARMMVPEPMRPGWEQALAMSASRIPHERLASIDQRIEMAAAKPVIIPDTVVIDHGRVFLSEVFLRAAGTLGISVQPAHQQTGTDKATIERTFLSINTLFCQHVAGYTGRDVTRRGSAAGSQELWSLADLQELLDEWVIAGWQCRPHEGLRHPFTPDQPCSPNDAYAALVAAAGYVPVALRGEDYIELMPADWRAIGDAGIRIDYRTYNSGELGPYRRMASGVAGKGTRWEVHFDPYDVSRVWVRNHHAEDGAWITVPWTHQSMVAQPFADFTWRHARKIAAERGVDDTNETAVAAVLGALLRRAGQGPESRRALARHRAMAALPPALPEEAMPPALPEPAAPPALSAAGDPGYDDGPDDDLDEDQVITGTVVGFGLFDPFGEDRGPRR
jgi:hypothetical protein